MKTRVFNLIILDESGSMSCIERQALTGVNETLQTIRRYPLPYILFIKGPFIITFLILTFHCAESAYRKQSERVFRLTFNEPENTRSHSYGKFVYLNAAQLCNGEMSEFMKSYQEAEHEQGNKYIDNIHFFPLFLYSTEFLTYSLAAVSAAITSS